MHFNMITKLGSFVTVSVIYIKLYKTKDAWCSRKDSRSATQQLSWHMQHWHPHPFLQQNCASVRGKNPYYHQVCKNSRKNQNTRCVHRQFMSAVFLQKYKTWRYLGLPDKRMHTQELFYRRNMPRMQPKQWIDHSGSFENTNSQAI